MINSTSVEERKITLHIKLRNFIINHQTICAPFSKWHKQSILIVFTAHLERNLSFRFLGGVSPPVEDKDGGEAWREENPWHPVYLTDAVHTVTCLLEVAPKSTGKPLVLNTKNWRHVMKSKRREKKTKQVVKNFTSVTHSTVYPRWDLNPRQVRLNRISK